MTFEEFVEVYEKKTGDKHVCPDGYTTLYDKDKGYAQYKLEGNRLRIYEVCGDGRYWYHLGAKICQDHDIPFIVTICTCKLKPYLRLMQLKPTKEYQQQERDGGWKIEGVNHLGLRFFCWPAWYDHERKKHAYYIVTEMTKEKENDENKIQLSTVQEGE